MLVWRALKIIACALNYLIMIWIIYFSGNDKPDCEINQQMYWNNWHGTQRQRVKGPQWPVCTLSTTTTGYDSATPSTLPLRHKGTKWDDKSLWMSTVWRLPVATFSSVHRRTVNSTALRQHQYIAAYLVSFLFFSYREPQADR